MGKNSSFVGKKMGYGSFKETEARYGQQGLGIDTTYKRKIRWQNRRPICPYGCGEEGSLLEIVVEDGKAFGIYTHSGDVKPFRAELQMAPKPTNRKIVIGPDGEPVLTEET